MSLQINNLSKSFSVRKLFSNISFCVNEGECVSLVGSNGSGKSTLMRIITGEERADEGSVTYPKESRIGYLPQEIFLLGNKPFGSLKNSLTLWELVIQSFERLRSMKSEIELIENEMAKGITARQDEYERLSTEYKNLGGYNWQAKASRLLKGFGFSEDSFDKPLSSFSGGWQMRAYFVKLLLGGNNYLLLDEPTNYLDIASISFLESYLMGFKGGILVVSHDRYFLDALSDSVVSLEEDKARVFSGNYSAYLAARDAWATEAEAAQARQNREKKRVERFIERFRYKATKASTIQSRIKQLEKIEKIEQIRALPKLHFKFPECESSGEVVIRCENVCKAFGDKDVLNNVSFTINRGDRVAIIGENGAGKTTLVRIIAGADMLYTGHFEIGYKVHLGYFAQDEEISFKGDETVYQRMLEDTPLDAVPRLRNLLGAFLFSGDDINKKVKLLSGGEKSRLGLARLMLKPHNILLLDEPTNHLDINSREALLNALDAFLGTIVIVSHDRFFLDTLATRVLTIENKKVVIYEGNYSQYLWAKKYREPLSTSKAPDDKKTSQCGFKQQLKADFKMQKQLSNHLQKLKKEIESAEKSITEIEQEISKLESHLANIPPSWNTEQITSAGYQHKNAVKRLEEAMAHWERLHAENDSTALKLARLKEEFANVE